MEKCFCTPLQMYFFSWWRAVISAILPLLIALLWNPLWTHISFFDTYFLYGKNGVRNRPDSTSSYGSIVSEGNKQYLLDKVEIEFICQLHIK